MNHDAWLEQAELYALGVLDGEELARFEAHLEVGCPECEAHLRQTRETLTLLPRSLTPIRPPAAVKARLLAQIAATHDTAAPLPLPSRRPWWPLGLGALAAAGLLLALGLQVYRTQHELQRAEAVVRHLQAELARRDQTLQALRTEVDSARQALQQAEGRAATLQAELARREDTLEAERQRLQQVERAVANLRHALAEREEALRLVATPQMRLVRLAGLLASPDATAQLLWNPAAGTGLLLTSGLPPLPHNRIYELWAIAGNEPMPAGLFAVDEGGQAWLRLPPLPRAKRFTKFAVTAEPAGGVPSPTGPMHLLGSP
jgi:anti-sigma-K factor RskA